MTPEEIDQLIGEKVAAAISAYAATQNSEEGSDAVGGQGAVDRGCSYKEFMHCKPLNFSGDEGTIGLVRWFEKLESVFHISGCADDNRVKYATCTLLGDALTWWSMYTQSVGVDAAYETTWEDFRQMMIEEYYPRNEIRKLETELLNLKIKGTDVVSYTQRFQELALLCPAMVTSEYKRIKIYVQGLSPQIQEGVTSFDPKTIQAAIRMAHKLIDQIVLQETMAENAKRKQDGNQGKNVMQYTNKKQKMDETCNAVQNVKRGYVEKLPYCGSCDRHHTGHCTIICNKCQHVGHAAMECKNIAPVAKAAAPGACYKCREMEHLRNNCSKLKESILKKPQGKAYMMIPKEVIEISNTEKGYKGKHPYCAKCGRHHSGQCTVVCKKCKKIGHMTKDCKIAAPMPITAIPMACYECGGVGHFKKNCPKLKERTLKQPKEEPI